MNPVVRTQLAAYLLAFFCLVLTAAIGIAAENEKLPLKLDLKKGDVHILNYRFKTELIDDENRPHVRNDMDVDLRFQVLELDDQGNYRIEVAFERLKWFSDASKLKHDSESPKNSKTNNSPFADALFDNPLVYTLTPSGEILQNVKVKGQDKLLEAINAQLNKKHQALSFEDSDFFEFMNRLGHFLSAMTFVTAPASAVGPGDSWTIMRMDGSKKFAIKYAFRAREEGEIKVDAQMRLPIREAPETILSMTVDEKTNWPKHSQFNINSKAPKAISKLVIESKD